MAVSGRRIGIGASGITGVGPVTATHPAPPVTSAPGPADDGSDRVASRGPAHDRPSRPSTAPPADRPSGAGRASAGDVSGNACHATTPRLIRPTRNMAIARRRSRAITHVDRATRRGGLSIRTVCAERATISTSLVGPCPCGTVRRGAVPSQGWNPGRENPGGKTLQRGLLPPRRVRWDVQSADGPPGRAARAARSPRARPP